MSHDTSDGEPYAVYDERATKARKAHACEACDETIQPGHVYTRVGIVWEGVGETVKRCAKCQAIHKHLRALGDGDMWPSEKLDCGEAYKDHWGKEPTGIIAEIAFMPPEEAQLRIAELALVCGCDDRARCYWCHKGVR